MKRQLLTALTVATLFSALAASAALRNRYSFTTDASDSAGAANGTLLGGANISGGAVMLNGSTAYVDLPNNLVTGYTAVTFETWVVNNGSGNWARILDFGNNSGGEGNAGTGTQYIFITPGPGAGVLRAAYTSSGNGSEQQVNAPSALVNGSLKHVVLTTDGTTAQGRLYVDGVLVGSNNGMTLTPAGIGPMNNVWLGRSQWSGDAFLNGSITEFRVWDVALTAAEVLANFQAGPDAVAIGGPVSVSTQPQNQTVGELQPASFSVAYSGARPVAVQWFRNDAPIPGATNDSYTLAVAALADSTAQFHVALTNVSSNTTYFATSSNAVLTVTPDLVAPTLVQALSIFPTNVVVEFSEGLRADTANSTGNYAITHAGGSLAISSAALDASQRLVTLTTAPQTLGTLYTLTVNGVRDLSAASNAVAPNSQATFTAVDYVATNIGAVAVSPQFNSAGDGYDFTAAGTGIGGGSDQFALSYRYLSGNFDLQVRLGSLPLSDEWARAGLMARDGFAVNARFAATLGTPGPAGCYFASRSAIAGTTALAGQLPANYPDTWLRLRRTGNVFDGFASLDGQTWQYLGGSTIAMPATVLVGYAMTSGSNATPSTAQFRQPSSGSGVITTNAPLPFEPGGPSSRRTALAITEIMYNPPGAWAGTNNLEFVELWNSGLVTEDLTGHRLTGDISYHFPANTRIAPGQFLVIAKDPAAAQSFYGVNCLGPYTNTLGNDGGTLRLQNELGGRLLEIDFSDEAPWPVAADGTGHSLVLTHASYGEGDGRAWSASDVMGGSPGRAEHWGAEPGRAVVINEFLANTDSPFLDFIELFNTSLLPVNISGAWLSDEAGTNKFRIPNGTVLAGRTAIAFDQNQLGFSLSSDGERILLVNSNQTRVLDAITFGATAAGVSSGRVPDGSPLFSELSARTPGTANAAPLYRSVVINEIMYNPISGSANDEYVELHNRGTGAVSLANWRLDGGVRFQFPSNAVIAAGGYVVVGENFTNLLAKYVQLNATNTFGNYDGTLANGGERLTLSMPEVTVRTNAQNIVSTNLAFIAVNEVRYREGGRWGQWSDGGGSSLELIDPWSDNRFGASWADSDESLKATWTTIDVTNVLEDGQTALMINQGGYYGQPNRFEFFTQGAGEALVDNLQFLNNNGPNLLANADFANGTNGYFIGGTCRKSFAEDGAGIGGTRALHLVATDRGDAGPNKVATPITANVLTNSPNTGTIRAQVKWLRGSPYVMFRTHGHWMEVTRRLDLPANPGTPGLVNSRRVANAGPVIADVSHTPVLPGAGQAVTVTARVLDRNGVATVTLNYRIDPATSFNGVAMNDAGTGGDAVAGDGIFSANIPAQSAGSLAAFYVGAGDAALPQATSRFPNDAPGRECLVRWGENAIGGSIGTYRLWVTASNVTAWTTREKNANDPIDATFVYGNSRAIYNVRTLYSGSPFHAPNFDGPMGSFANDYEINFHKDEKFLGSADFVCSGFDVPSGNFFFTEKTTQADQTGNWIARKLGQPFNARRHVHMVFNGLRRGTIYDDVQQPSGEWLSEYFPDDSHGELRKIEDWFEFADDAITQGITTASVGRFLKAAGGVDSKRYRWTWRPRSTDDPDNWYSLTNLMLAINDTTHPNFIARVNGWMDVRNFLRPIVTHHICGDWDSYGYERGKNMYAYKPDHDGWRTLMWDIELGLGVSNGRVPTDSIYNIQDTVLLNFLTNNPAINREYLAGFQEALATSFAPGAADPLLDERYASLLQNGVAAGSPQTIKDFISQRRSYLTTQLPAANFAVNGTNFLIVGTNNLVTLTGTASLLTREILINGTNYPITWTSTTAWSIRLPLAAGTNALAVAALDRADNTLSNLALTVVYTGVEPAAQGGVVFNEIMYNPLVPDTEFVELFNNSTNFTFNLTGWRINGLSFTFPDGAFISPRSFLLLVKNTAGFASAYGYGLLPFDDFDGGFDHDGETLTLLRPGALPGAEIVVDRVRYEAARPWVQEASGGGGALQLEDSAQDNSRAGNWASAGEWRYATTTGTANSSRLYVYLTGVGDLFLDDIKIVLGSVPEAGPNLLRDGDFETPLAGNWNIPTGNTLSHLSTTNLHDGAGSFHLVSTNPAVVLNAIVTQDITPALTVGQTYTLSYWYRPKPATPNLILRMSAGTLNSTISPAPVLATPGTVNATYTVLPPFPTVWLNEVQPLNTTGLADNQGEREPWVELYNDGTNLVSLAGLYLSDSYSNLTKWAFPGGATLSPGEFKVVFLDGEPGETTPTEWHASFRLNSGNGSVSLTRVLPGPIPQVVDYLNFTAVPANRSYGDFADGQPFFRHNFDYTTPSGTNNGASIPKTIFINEWMASNTGVIRDPADNDADDWFELYNPNATPVDLSGWFLTDTVTNRFLSQYQVPENGQYVIPAGGYLLVWADAETGQNATNVADLHVNFSLRAGGESIGLFAPDGTLVDAVFFGEQTNNVSMGRSPDGGTNIVFLTSPSPRAKNATAPSGPVVTDIDVDGLNVTITFSSTPGSIYRVQFKNQLEAANWSNLPIDVLAAGASSIKTDTNNGTQRFYRVVLLP